MISEEFELKNVLFFLNSIGFSEKPKNFGIPKKLKKPKFTNFYFSGWEKIDFIHSKPKFFTDHESALRIFKNESKI